MKNEPMFKWDPEEGTATCVLTDGDNLFIGIATCSPNDRDMMSEKTGFHIATYRAKIDYLKHLRDNDLKPRLAALKQLYYSINQSKRFNKDSYETKMLQKQIYLVDTDLNFIKNEIARTKHELKTYLEEKGNFYKKVREQRQKGQK